jgi:hypothetical protein
MQIGASGLPMLKQQPDNRQTFQNAVMRSVSSEQSASGTLAKRRDANQNDTPDMPHPKSKGLAAYEAMENGTFMAQYG